MGGDKHRWLQTRGWTRNIPGEKIFDPEYSEYWLGYMNEVSNHCVPLQSCFDFFFSQVEQGSLQAATLSDYHKASYRRLKFKVTVCRSLFWAEGTFAGCSREKHRF